MGIIGDAINGATGGVLTHAMGMVFGGAEDDRQLNQQKRLQQLQMDGAMKLADQSRAEQQQLWDSTNYEAQVAHAENAGLNPAMLYAKGGAGGTTGSGNVPMPTAGHSADAASRQSANTQMALMASQMQQMQAQTENARAQTDKTIAEKTGIDLDNQLKGRTQDNNAMTIAANADKAMADARVAGTNANTSEATQLDNIHKIQANAMNEILQGAVMKSGIKVNQAEIENIVNQIVNRNRDTQIKAAQQNTNQQNIELQHGDRMQEMKQQLENWEGWREIAERQQILDSFGKILQGGKGGGTSMTDEYKEHPDGGVTSTHKTTTYK